MRTSRVVPVIVVLVLVVAVLVILVVLRPPPLVSQPTPTSQSSAEQNTSAATSSNNKETINLLMQAVLQDDRDTLLSLLAPDFVAHIPENPLFDTSLDSSLLDEVVSIFHAAVPSLSIESEILVEEGNYVGQRALITGDFESEFYDYPPNNNPVQFAVNIFYRFDESGKIAEQWIELDSVVVMRQFEIS